MTEAAAFDTKFNVKNQAKHIINQAYVLFDVSAMTIIKAKSTLKNINFPTNVIL